MFECYAAESVSPCNSAGGISSLAIISKPPTNKICRLYGGGYRVETLDAQPHTTARQHSARHSGVTGVFKQSAVAGILALFAAP